MKSMSVWSLVLSGNCYETTQCDRQYASYEHRFVCEIMIHYLRIRELKCQLKT